MQLKKILGFSFGPVMSLLLGIITIPVIAWTFSPEDIGRMNVFQTALSFMLLLSILGLDQAYVREYHESADKHQLLLSCFFPGFALLILLAGISLFFSTDLALFLYLDSEPYLYWITALSFLVSYITRFLSLILRMEERGWAYSLSQVGPKLIQLFLVCVFAVASFKKEFVHLQLLTLASMLLVMLFYIWNTRKQLSEALRKKLETALLRKLFHFGTPLIFSGLAFWGLSATSTVVLRSMSTLDELALYSIANSFAAAAIVFQSIFSVVWAPTVYKWVSQGLDMVVVDKIAIQALAVICVIVALSGSFGWVLNLILPEHYQTVQYIFLCMLIQPLLYTLSEITCVGIAIQRKTIYTVWIALFAMLSNFGLSYFLVPSYGAAGAAMANSISFFIFFFARTEVSARIWRPIPRLKIYAFTLVLVLMVVVQNKFHFHLQAYTHVIWPMVFLFFCFIFRLQFQQIWNAIIKSK